jgi:hypothetical protein
VRGGGGGHQQHTAGVLVEPVNDAGPGQAGKRRIPGQQPIDEGSIRIPGTGMHHQPGWLVDHQQILVLVQHSKCQRLPGGPILPQDRLGIDGQALAAAQALLGLDPCAIHGERSCGDPVAQGRSGEIVEQLRRRLVDPLARELRWNLRGPADRVGPWRHGGIAAARPAVIGEGVMVQSLIGHGFRRWICNRTLNR